MCVGQILPRPADVGRCAIQQGLQPEPGTYVLWLRLDKASRLAVGGLGVVALQPGHYAYVGSAFGPGGVRARLGRHFRREKEARWHIDYLRSLCRVEAAWVCYRRRCEHQWADLLSGWTGARVPVAHFGSSDCRCPAHLVVFAKPPSIRAFIDRDGYRGAHSIVAEIIV